MFGSEAKKQSIRRKILVVDDEPDYLSAVQCRLEWCNYEVITAANGQEGLEKAEAERPDLILLDTNMPIMNGYDTLNQLRKHPDLKAMPVIMVTALFEMNDIVKASSYDVADYVAKPFDFTELVEKIANVLGNKKAFTK